MNGSIMSVNGVRLCVDTVGDPHDPAVLLMGGAGGAMDWWEDEFCDGLAGAGRFVIRYDSRDTGQSVTYPAGAPGYTGADLAADAVGVLDALGLRGAHLVGLSMGGGLAQRIAVDHPDRVDSLVLMSTTAALPGGTGMSHLPPMSDELRAYFAAPPPEPDWSDRTAVVEYLVDFNRRLSGPEYFDEPHERGIAGRIVERSTDMAASMTNHGRIEEGEPPRYGLADVSVPTLVVHGTADPLFPYGHAEALAREIPHAVLLPLPGVGHQVPPRAVWPTVIPAILRHTSAARDAHRDRPAWAPPQLDLDHPSAARVYDYLLGGSHNFRADREVGDRMLALAPEAREAAQANRAFLRRAVRYLTEIGIRQFLDIGSGIPTRGNVHEIAQRYAPSSRVVYVDIDPVAVAHSQAILAGDPNSAAVSEDLRRPGRIVDNPQVRKLLDFEEPVAVLLLAVLHFLPDAEGPANIVARLRDAMVPGSYLAISHAAWPPHVTPTVMQARHTYDQTATPLILRTPQQVQSLFSGFELIEPGLVTAAKWRPEEAGSPASDDRADRLPAYAAVGIKR